MTTLNSRTGATGALYQSPEWRTLRLEKLTKHQYRCQVCTARNLRNDVHHKRPVRQYPHLALDPGNLLLLCRRCHESLHVVAQSPILRSLVPDIASPNFWTARRLDFGPVPIQLGLALDERAANEEWTLDPPLAVPDA